MSVLWGLILLKWCNLCTSSVTQTSLNPHALKAVEGRKAPLWITPSLPSGNSKYFAQHMILCSLVGVRFPEFVHLLNIRDFIFFSNILDWKRWRWKFWFFFFCILVVFCLWRPLLWELPVSHVIFSSNPSFPFLSIISKKIQLSYENWWKDWICFINNLNRIYIL